MERYNECKAKTVRIVPCNILLCPSEFCPRQERLVALFHAWFANINSTRRPVAGKALPLLCLLSACTAGGATAQNSVPVPAAPKRAVAVQPTGALQPDLRVEYFGAERGYSVGLDNVPVLCILRNVGIAALPANSVRLYCYPLVGLNYVSGEIKPTLPELAPGQSVAFRWQLAPSNGQGRLLTAVMLQSNAVVAVSGSETVPAGKGISLPGGAAALPGAPMAPSLPRAVLAAIPHFASPPSLGNIRAGNAAGPIAAARPGEAWLANDRVSLHLRAAAGDEAVLSLAAKEGANWHVLATANPLVEILSSEDGQKAWWQRFQWQETAVRSNRDEGVLTLVGAAGPRWSVEFIASAHRDTGVVEGRIRLTARQTTRLFGVRLPSLLVQTDPPGGGLGRADGRAILLPAENPPASDAARPLLVATHRGSITYGLVWPSHAPLDGWTTETVTSGNSSLISALGGVWRGLDHGDIILAGASIEIPFRFFAYAPSDTVDDAQRFVLP